MKFLDKKEGSFYNHKVLAVCVFVLIILCFVGLVYGDFEVTWVTPSDATTIAISNLTGAGNYTFIVNVTRASGLTNITNVTIYRKLSGITTWTEWASNTTFNLTEYKVIVSLNGSNGLNGTFDLNVTVRNNSITNYSVIGVTIDTIRPVVSLANATDMNITATTINYQYTATDFNLSTCRMYFGVNGSWVMVKENTNVTTDSITENVTNESLSDGIYYFSVYCNDTLSNDIWNTTNTSFAVDTKNPIINSINLSIDSITSYVVRRSHTEVNVTINVTDNTTGVKNVSVNDIYLSQDGEGSDTWSKIINITKTPLDINVSDHVGYIDSDNSVTVTYDEVAPLTTFANDSTIVRTTWYNKNLRIELSATNGSGGIAGVDFIMHRNGTSGSWTIWSSNLTFCANLTSNTFQFRANDTIGNVEGYQTRIIRIDRRAPGVTAHSLSSPSVGISGSLIVAVNITDNLYGSGLNTSLLYAWHNGTGGNNASSKQLLYSKNGIYFGTLTAPNSAGGYKVTFNATDFAGNSNGTTTKVFNVSTSIPTINANVSNDTYVLNNTVIGFTIAGATTTHYNSSTSLPFSTPSAGTQINVTIKANASAIFVLQVHANKSDTNTTNATYVYKIDNVIPPISFNSLLANQLVNGTTTITAVSVDNESKTASVTFFIGVAGDPLTNKTTDTTTPYIYDWNTLDNTDGNYTINITAMDNMGNVNSTMIHVTINNSRAVTQSVSSGVADFAGTIIEDHVPQISGLNSSTAVVVVSHGETPFISGGTTDRLSSTKMYLNISADTPDEARIYFKLGTDQITSSDTNKIGVYMDHNEDGSYEPTGAAVTYINQIGDYYNFYFTTINLSIFAIGIKTSPAGPSGGVGGGGSSISTYPISFTSTPVKIGLRVDDQARFSFNGVAQTIRATKIIAGSAAFKIFPIGRTIEFKKGESKDIDLDNDGTNDLRLTLDYIHGTRKAFIFVKNISKAKKMTAFKIIDIIKNFYAGSTKYTAFEIIDIIRAFYGGN